MYSTLPTQRKLSRALKHYNPKSAILWWTRAIRKRPFVWLLLFLLVGILLAKWYLSLAIPLIAFALAIALFCSALIYRKQSLNIYNNFLGMGLAALIICLGASISYKSLWQLQGDAAWLTTQQPTQFHLVSEPSVKNKNIRMQVRVLDADAKLLLYVPIRQLDDTNRWLSLLPGQAISVGKLSFKPTAKLVESNPGFARYLNAQGLCGTAFASHPKLIDSRSKPSPWPLLLRRNLLRGLEQMKLSADQEQMLAAMSLGKRDESESLRQVFASTGTSHILSVSGFHVGIVLATALGVFGIFIRSKRLEGLKWLLVLATGWGFAAICGFNPPVLRAMLMASLYATAKMLRRQADASNTIAATAFLTLLFKPLAIDDIGFQLSYTAVFSILLFYPILLKLIPKVQQPVMLLLWQSLCVGLAAQVLSIPIVLHHFGTSSSTFIWGNLPTVLIATILIPLSLLTLGSALVFGAIWAPLARAVEWLSQLCLSILEQVARIPLSPINWQPSLSTMLLIYLLILSIWRAIWIRRSSAIRV